MAAKASKKPEKTELAFGRIPAYCRYELYMERYRSAAEVIRAHRTLSPETRILDVGPGEGRFRYFFDADEGSWFGVDFHDRNFETCARLGYRMSLGDVNGTPLPYPDEHFDVVLASHVIEHLTDVDFCLSELDRVLRKGGLLLIATPTKPPGIAWLLQRRRRGFQRALGGTQLAFSVLSLKRYVGTRLRSYRLLDGRGLRIVSARKKLKLENWYPFYRANTLLARYLTLIVPEVNLIYEKRG